MVKQNVVIEKQAHDVVFSGSYLKKMLADESIGEAKQYIHKFFKKHVGDGVFFYDALNSEYKLIDNKALSNYIGNDAKIDTEECKFSAYGYLKSTRFLETQHTPTINFHKEQIYTDTIIIDKIPVKKIWLNMKKELPCIDYNETVSRESIQDMLDSIYRHIKNVLCSKHEDQYEFVLNFIACSFGGRKIRKCLYMQSAERTGKGTIISFLQAILGDRMYKTNSTEAIEKYTKRFEGRCLLNFDELPVENYKSIADRMITLITEDEFECRTMRQDGYQQVNTFNIIVTSNNDCISFTQTNKTKYVCLDIDESFIGNHKYFSDIHIATNDKNVRLAFYNDMMKRFTLLQETKWNEDKHAPSSETLKLKIIEALPKFIKFLKDRYILKNENLSMKTDDFFQYYYNESKDTTSKQKIGKYLKKLDILPKKMKKGLNQYYIYESTCDKLHEQFKKNDWMDNLTDIIQGNKQLPVIFNSDALDKGVDKSNQSINIINEYKKQIERMKIEHERNIKVHENEMKLFKIQQTYNELVKTSEEIKQLSSTVFKNKPKKEENIVKIYVSGRTNGVQSEDLLNDDYTVDADDRDCLDKFADLFT
jgi:hypothetical protein